MAIVTLNIDVGELAGEPEALYRSAHVVHVACGGHAGNRETMGQAVCSAKRWGAVLGAHPSYPDKAQFGRVSMPLAESDLAHSLEQQLRTLAELAQAESSPLQSVKAHGALYHDIAREPRLANLFLDVIARLLKTEVTLVGPPHSVLLKLGEARGFSCKAEGFADRGKEPSGALVPRGQPGALLSDPRLCALEAQNLARTGLYQTLCVHGDTPNAAQIAEAVRSVLDADVS